MSLSSTDLIRINKFLTTEEDWMIYQGKYSSIRKITCDHFIFDKELYLIDETINWEAETYNGDEVEVILRDIYRIKDVNRFLDVDRDWKTVNSQLVCTMNNKHELTFHMEIENPKVFEGFLRLKFL